MKRFWLCGWLLLLSGCAGTNEGGRTPLIEDNRKIDAPIGPFHITVVLPEHRHLLPWRNKPKPQPTPPGAM